jgi:hypothetical protein
MLGVGRSLAEGPFMSARRSLLSLPLFLLAGCLPLELLDPSLAPQQTPLVPSTPFESAGTVQQTVARPQTSEASTEMALRVDLVGRKVLGANPSIGVRPLFATLGAAPPEIFHQGTQVIYVTEGLVKRCKNDGELAALLCLELGKMVSEREALSRPRGPRPEGQRPISVPIGNMAEFNAPDQVAVAELNRYETERKQTIRRGPPPDPQVLAGGYLQKAGYEKGALDTIAPLLDAADRNYLIEKQFKTPLNAPQWSPVTAQ